MSVTSSLPSSDARPSPLRLVKTEGPSDDALCREFLAGNDAAFGELVRRHQSWVFGVARRYCPRPEDARDLAQRVFLQAFQAARRALKRAPSHERLDLRAWLARIAVNLGKNHLRAARRWAMAPVEALEGAPAEGPGAAESLELAQKQRLIRGAIWSLPARQREVFILRIDGGLSFAEVGRTLGIQEGNAKAHFHLAVKRLKSLLAEGEPAHEL